MAEEAKIGERGAVYGAIPRLSDHWYRLLSILGFGMNVTRLEKDRVYEAA